MLKTYPVRELSRKEKAGEYVLGVKDLGSHACYLIYGELAADESGRKVCPGRGHEEILLAAAGDLKVSGVFNGVLKEGEALHLKEDDTCLIANESHSRVVYVLSGGHSDKQH